MNKSFLSIIVPVLNEIEILPEFINNLNQQSQSPQELIIVDGGSTDGSWEWLNNNPSIKAYQTQKGRAFQMNHGVENATLPWIYFVHVDSRLPVNFDEKISNAIQNGAQSGCFQLKFDTSNWILRKAATGSKWNHLLCRGGDQTLFVSKKIFLSFQGYDTSYRVCEDIQFIKKLYQQNNFRVLPDKVITSSRRFYENGILRLLFHFGVLHLSHWLGVGPQFLNAYYQRMIH